MLVVASDVAVESLMFLISKRSVGIDAGVDRMKLPLLLFYFLSLL